MAEPEKPLPRRIVSERLELRALGPGDAERLNAATAANEEHLAPWLPWAHELPRPIERMREHLARLDREFELGRDFNFAVELPGDRSLVGGLGIHARCGPGGLEIGYWIAREHNRRGYATEAAAVATQTAIELLGAERVEIHVQPGNAISMRIPERLGFRSSGVRRKHLRWRDGSWRDQVIWVLPAGELDRSPAAAVPYRAFDAAGTRLAVPQGSGAGTGDAVR